MNDVINLSWWQLLLFSCTLLIPYAINVQLKLNLGKDILVSVLRMSLQLILVGIYLEYLFKINSLTINLVWLAAMLAIGASSIVSKSHLPQSKVFVPVLAGLSLGLLPILSLCVLIIRPNPIYSAQYIIPLAGMLLGNSLSGNIVALQNLFTALQERKYEYEGALSLGASPLYATLPFVRSALQKSLAPILASMTTTGLVTLPGMMTGQILGGANPLVAIKYQLLIMIAIFVTMSISTAVTLRLAIPYTINKEGRVLVKLRSNH